MGYYKNAGMSRTITYDKQNRNFLLGKLFVEYKLLLDGERVGHIKLDTRATPYTMAWPKMTADASDLEFGVTITPDRKVVTKFGWEWAGVKKVYLDVVGNNPWIGDYKLSRQGEFEEVSGSLYKIKWT